MSTHTAHIIAFICIIALLAVVNAWLESEAITNWHIQQYNKQPRVNPCPFRRSRLHRFLLRIIFFPVIKPKQQLSCEK